MISEGQPKVGPSPSTQFFGLSRHHVTPAISLSRGTPQVSLQLSQRGKGPFVATSAKARR